MTVAAVSAGLTGGIVFAISILDKNNVYGTLRTVLSTSFLSFTFSLFSAFFVRIEVRTEPKFCRDIIRRFYRGQGATRFAIISSAIAVTAGYVLDGAGLILVGQRVVGGLTVGFVGMFGAFASLTLFD